MRYIIEGQESLDLHNKFLTFSPTRQRLEYYSQRNSYSAHYSFIYEDDTKLCLGNETRIIRYSNNKAWSHSNNNTQGFTYDKTTKKFKFWYKSVPNSFTEKQWSEILAHTGNEWLEEIFPPIKSLMTATMFGKIFSKKITDPIEFCKVFIKSKPWLKNTDITPEQLYAFLLSIKHKGFLGNYIQMFAVAESVTSLIHKVSEGVLKSDYFYHSLASNALALNMKIDFMLSVDELRKLDKDLQSTIEFNYSLLTL